MMIDDIIILEESGLPFLTIDSWETPATKYPIFSKVGSAKITRKNQRPGIYLMEGVRGSDYYSNTIPILITSLQIGREVVMVDDPLNWYGMQDLAKNCKGKVLIAGLGLGLILHALQSNNEVTEIYVIESNKDVIDLMKNNIPTDSRIKIIHEDFWDYIDKIGLNRFEDINEKFKEYIKIHKIVGDYDTVLIDIWWGKGSPEIGREMTILKIKLQAYMPNAKIMIWGICDKDLNPAVTRKTNYH